MSRQPSLRQIHQSGATDGEVATWDDAAGMWVPAPGGGSLALDDLTDVDTTSTPPADGDVLTWDSGSSLWVPAAPTGGGGLEPWQIDVDVLMPPATQTRWALLQNPGLRAYKSSTSAHLNAQIGWDLLFSAGTWDCDIMFFLFTDRGIITIALDGTTVGTVDQYGSAADAIIGTATGFTVAASGKKRVTFTLATKNASASDYGAGMQGVRFRRTA